MKLKTLIISLMMITTISTATTVTTNTKNIPLQKGNSNPQVIYRIPNSNTVLEKLNESSLFYNVNFNGQNGWIAKQYTVEGKKELDAIEAAKKSAEANTITSIPKVYGNSIVKTDMKNALPAVNEAQLAHMIKSYCSGARETNLLKLTSSFIKMQNTYKVNAVFAVAVSILESSGGTYGKLLSEYKSYNMYSIKGTYNGAYVTFRNEKWKKYPNFHESIMDFGNLIANKSYYFKAGKFTIASIAPTYCDTAWGNEVYTMMGKMYNTLSSFSGSKTNISSSSSSTSLSSNFKIIYVGDSRVVHMKNHVPASSNNTVYIAKSGEGLSWLKSTGYPELKKALKSYPNSVVVFCLGINDRPNIDSYISFYKNTVLKELSNKEIYFMTVNPVNEKVVKSSLGYNIYNSTITTFNNKLKSAFPNKIIDTYSVLINYMGNGTTDGLHYKESVSKLVHTTTKQAIQNMIN